MVYHAEKPIKLIQIKAVTALTKHHNREQIDKTKNCDNPVYKRELGISKFSIKIPRELITQAMNGTLVANRCNHQVLGIE